MAHLGEAQGVIDSFNLKKTSEGVYQNEQFVLVLTGEGPFEAATKTALALSAYNITKVLNLGIAGTLDNQFKKGEIHPVRSIYLVQNLIPQFKTFQSFDKGLDCITSFERILDPDKAQFLKGIGTLVDREAWGVAFACKTKGVPFESYKLISDVAGTQNACEVIKGEAEEFAGLIKGFLKEKLQIKTKEFNLPGFYFTFTSTHQFHDLINKLSIKLELNQEQILEEIPLKDLRELEITPKERTKKLLQILDKKLDPVKSSLEQKKSDWMKTFEKSGIKVQTDPQWENPSVTFSFEATSDESLKEKIAALEKVSMTPFLKLMNGEFHVE